MQTILKIQFAAAITVSLSATWSGAAEGPASVDDAFKTAVAVWHMGDLQDAAGKNRLAIVGNVTVVKKLQGKDLQESFACGNDGIVAQFDGGYLNARQGTDGMLNLTGSALTLSVRLRSPSGVWGRPLVSKHGGHDRLVYNLFSFDNAIGFELGTEKRLGMTQVLAPLAKIGRQEWHTVVCRYDGTRLRMIVDGVLMDEASAEGPLRRGNTEPCLLGAESYGGQAKSGWKGLIDHAALWSRALSDAEVERLSGGAVRVAAARKRFAESTWSPQSVADMACTRSFTADVRYLVFPCARGRTGQNHLSISVDGKYSFWTGGAAVDVENTTGLGKPGKPAIVYSANNGDWGPSPFTQCVFVSTDGGMTALWNPELMYKPLPKEASRRGGGTRDPMILWYAPEKKWVLVVYNQAAGRNGFYFFESKDLKDWQETGVLQDMFECPNLFELPVDGNTARRKWVTWGSDTAYHLGTFNGRTFIPDGPKLRTHYGQFSASQVFANAPGGRIVQIGWGHPCDYDAEFSRMASFPLELSLRTTPEGGRLYADFIPELAGLRNQGSQQKVVVVKAGAPLKVGDVPQPEEILAEFDPGSSSQVIFTGAELNVSWGAQNRELNVNGEKTRLSPKNGRLTLHILLDIPSVEVVTSGGDYIIKGRDYRKLGEKSPMEIRVDGGDVTFSRLEVYPLKSIH